MSLKKRFLVVSCLSDIKINAAHTDENKQNTISVQAVRVEASVSSGQKLEDDAMQRLL